MHRGANIWGRAPPHPSWTTISWQRRVSLQQNISLLKNEGEKLKKHFVFFGGWKKRTKEKSGPHQSKTNPNMKKQRVVFHYQSFCLSIHPSICLSILSFLYFSFPSLPPFLCISSIRMHLSTYLPLICFYLFTNFYPFILRFVFSPSLTLSLFKFRDCPSLWYGDSGQLYTFILLFHFSPTRCSSEGPGLHNPSPRRAAGSFCNLTSNKSGVCSLEKASKQKQAWLGNYGSWKSIPDQGGEALPQGVFSLFRFATWLNKGESL